MLRINLDLNEINRFERVTLTAIKKVAFPLAVKGTLNSVAFEIMKNSRRDIKDDFVNRNRYTERSVKVDPVKTLKMSDMVATVGSTAPYMRAQEEGETRVSKGKQGLRIPSGAAAGQSTLFPRKKVVKKKYRRGQIKLANRKGRIKAKSRRQFILMSIRVAALKGESPYIFLGLKGKETGIYKVIAKGSPPKNTYQCGSRSFVRKNKWGRPKGKPGMEKLVFIHSHAKRRIEIPETRWLSKNVEKSAATLSQTFTEESDRVFARMKK